MPALTPQPVSTIPAPNAEQPQEPETVEAPEPAENDE